MEDWPLVVWCTVTLRWEGDIERVEHEQQKWEGRGWKQCDQIGLFLKVLGIKFAYKSSPKTFVTIWAIFKRSTLCKNYCGICLGNFWKHLGYIFIRISGHTGCKQIQLSFALAFAYLSWDVWIEIELEQKNNNNSFLQFQTQGRSRRRRRGDWAGVWVSWSSGPRFESSHQQNFTPNMLAVN